MSLVESLARSIDVVTPDLIEVRRDLHQYPELSWHEERTTDVVAMWMDKSGIPYERFDGTGLMADVGPDEGPIVALRADLDGLPVADSSQDPWRSTVPGVSHSCGHDVHVAALLGAGVALAQPHLADVERRVAVQREDA
jgi:metal-dependent amidase/aminoacylase/carboxypeptidase family protein